MKQTLPWLVIGSVWLWFCWPMLAGEQIAGYRDSTYLYYPLLRWIDGQFQMGEFPLWMPYENAGYPLLADGTSSILYPGKLIFGLRWISFPARYGWYLSLHILLAASGSYCLARRLGADPAGATLSGIGFGFGGSYIFQVCNVVYLVSGSWLPWALICVWKMQSASTQNSGHAPILGAIACSMMILGGDPQMVYHVGLIALLTSICSFFNPTGSWRQLVQTIGRLAVMSILTGVLSAAQLLPTFEWANYSDRSDFQSTSELIFLPNSPPHSDVYQFSLEPWMMADLLIPNIFGKDAPVNTRWSAALPGADRIWTPSIYLGCLTLLWALAGVRFKQKPTPCLRWMQRIAVGFFIASWGWYGPVWLISELTGHNVIDQWLGPASTPDYFNQPVGGLYWLMTIALPKYSIFRYPAKLMTVSSLAICVLAGLNLKHANHRRATWLAAIALSVVIACGILLNLPATKPILQRCQTTGLFGPFQPDQCLIGLQTSTLTAGGFLLVAWGLLSLSKRTHATESELSGNSLRTGRWLPWGFVILTAADLTANNRWLLHLIDANIMQATIALTEEIDRMRQAHDFPSGRPLSIIRSQPVNYGPIEWEQTSSDNRMAEVAAWRRQSLFPKNHLAVPGVLIQNSFTSIWPAAYERALADDDHSGNFNVEFGESKNDNHHQLTLSRRTQQSPLAWIAAPDDSHAVNSGQGRAVCHFSNTGQTIQIKIRQQDNHPPTPTRILPASTPNRRNNQPQIDQLILRLFPMPGWTATVKHPNSNTTERIDVQPAGETYSQLSIPPGDLDIELRYQPSSFFIGAFISAIGWLAIGASALLKWKRRTQNSTPKKPRPDK